MTQEQLNYIMQLMASGQQPGGSQYQPPSIWDVPTGTAEMAPGGPGGQGIRQSDVNQAIQPNMDLPPDIPAVAAPNVNQQFSDLLQQYLNDPSRFLASNEPAGQVGSPGNQYQPPVPSATPASTPNMPYTWNPGDPLSGPAPTPISDVSGRTTWDPLTFADLTNLNLSLDPEGQVITQVS